MIPLSPLFEEVSGVRSPRVDQRSCTGLPHTGSRLFDRDSRLHFFIKRLAGTSHRMSITQGKAGPHTSSDFSQGYANCNQ